jgi:hypothetical protein
VIDVESKICPCCGGALHKIGETVKEMLDVVPVQYQVKRMVRPRYGCRGCESAVVQAPAPAQPIDGGMATEAMLAHVATMKYGYQVPPRIAPTWERPTALVTFARRERPGLPAEPTTVVGFVDAQAELKSPATVRRYIATIAHMHRAAGLAPDTGAPVTAVNSRAPISLNTLTVLSSKLSDMRSIRLNKIWSARFLFFSACEAATSLFSRNCSLSAPRRDLRSLYLS